MHERYCQTKAKAKLSKEAPWQSTLHTRPHMIRTICLTHVCASRAVGQPGASIPGSAFRAGDMVRWAVTANDTGGGAARDPPFLAPTHAQYYGTITRNPALTSTLPVLDW